MKKKYGDVTPITDDKESNDATLTEDGHSISYRDLNEVIRIRVDELIRLIILELPHTDYAKVIPSGLILTGGTANLPGIAELAEQITRLPVRVGIPVNLYGISDTLLNPAYATSVGLLLWRNKRKEGMQTWRPKSSSGFLAKLGRIFR
jgi:cell division protein FtsA